MAKLPSRGPRQGAQRRRSRVGNMPRVWRRREQRIPIPKGRLILAAHALAPEEEEFGRMFESLSKMFTSEAELESILRLDRELQAEGWEGLVKEAIISGDGPSIRAFAARQKALISLGGACAPPARRLMDAPGWISQYPEEFEEALKALAFLGPDAERTARRVFGQDFIPTDALHAEIAVLEAKIRASSESRGLGKRLINLRSRLASALSVRPERSLRLRKRLDGAVRREVFRRWKPGFFPDRGPLRRGFGLPDENGRARPRPRGTAGRAEMVR